MTEITDGIFPELLATKIEIDGEEKEPSVGAESPVIFETAFKYKSAEKKEDAEIIILKPIKTREFE